MAGVGTKENPVMKTALVWVVSCDYAIFFLLKKSF